MTQLAFLRAQQRDLARIAEVVRTAAETMDDGSPMQIWDALTAVVCSVNRQLLPCLDADEDILYSTLRAVSDSAEPVRILQVHTKELERLSAELHDSRNALLAGEHSARSDLRRVLYGLYAVLSIHLRTRAEVIVPFLEAELDARDREKVEIAMRAVTARLDEPGDHASDRAG